MLEFVKEINLGGKRDLALVVAMIGILVVLFIPIPSGLLDLLLITNFSFGLLIFMLTFYSEKPLSFSTFPSLLLITTLFRLSLNIAATRLILSDGDAGKVIGAIGSYVVGGNYVIGLVVFLILVVVQYVVVTNGAQRVAEVAARFTLDSMPGKQMSIDADLNMGIIDDKEAKKRRANIEKEANFYGSMDGATKFVKGDAIAGIIIILIDIIGGLSIGVVQHGMSWGQALQTYTLLTVGDGIVTQIPSLVVAVATGIIITRAATDSQLGSELVNQIVAHPRSLLVVTAALFCVLFLPGLPVIPVFVLFLIFAGATYYALNKEKQGIVDNTDQDNQDEEDNESIDSLLKIHPIELSIGQRLVDYVKNGESLILEQIEKTRKQYALESGFLIPEVKIKDGFRLGDYDYDIRLNGTSFATGTLQPEKVLAINPKGKPLQIEGQETHEPAYNLPATWIDVSQKDKAKELNYTVVNPDVLLITHLNEVIKKRSYELLTRTITESLINRVRKDNSGLLEELIPNILSYSEIQSVFSSLLKERVSIRNLDLILDVLVDVAKVNKSHDNLVDSIRIRLGAQICETLKSKNGLLNVLTLDPDLEQNLLRNIRVSGDAKALVVEPNQIEQITSNIASAAERMMTNNLLPIIVCSPSLRSPFKKFVDRVIPNISVISLGEIPETINVHNEGRIIAERG